MATEPAAEAEPDGEQVEPEAEADGRKPPRSDEPATDAGEIPLQGRRPDGRSP